MNRTPTHRITVCTSCRHKGETCKPGYELIAKLRTAIAAAGDSIAEDFEITGTARVAACDRPCTVAYHATRSASYLFGDITPDEDIDALMDFARQHDALDDGWGGPVEVPDMLCAPNLSRVPATIMAIEDCMERVS
ncbi:DUF1636 domain-containing protein [Shimia sp. R9_2]|uniref:DUF1636 family protein n=1 Tax=Shimia sp. R9_2 TaxID=2821112 RepID=UPI001ADC2D10|nr:DUF1636 domain-containing protein [Shimia sp. R9_2]MBO9398629.1 DUF1636 domain-containing protein [Shimia sp. R9_2]